MTLTKRQIGYITFAMSYGLSEMETLIQAHTDDKGRALDGYEAFVKRMRFSKTMAKRLIVKLRDQQ